MKSSDFLDLQSEAKKSPAQAGLSYREQTIAALASGRGGAVAIVRVSGSRAFAALAECILEKKSFRPRTMYLASLIDPQSASVIDQLMLCLFPNPQSFTGEDVAELHCHGGPYIVQRILEVLYSLGCRAAEPGEFTRRAFLNGKMDLTVAEGIKQLVEASSQQQWQAARQLATGTLFSYIEDLRQELIGAMAYLEASIDFPDEGDTQHVALEHVEKRVYKVSKKVNALLSRYDNGRIASSGLKVAIVGAPNMGKSTLLNLLLGKDRAIVSAQAGTTRDYIEESCLIEGRLIRLIDTAGMRDAREEVEKIGVEQATRLADEADLIIALSSVDASPEEQGYVKQVLSKMTRKPEELLKVVNKVELLDEEPPPQGSLYISCHKLIGIDILQKEIAKRVDHSLQVLDEQPFVTTARHKKALLDSQAALENFFSGINNGLYEEMLAFELQQVVKRLSSIIGELDHDDLLDRIFSEFCVGK